MITVLMISIAVGIALAEIGTRIFRASWPRREIRKILALPQLFREAQDDDARQALALRSGRATLQFSLIILGLLTILAGIASAGPWMLDWTPSQQLIYATASSICATGWCWVRRCGRAKID